MPANPPAKQSTSQANPPAKTPPKAANNDPFPTFLEYVAAAKRTGIIWVERVENQLFIDTWHKGAERDPNYALAVFTVYLCFSYGVISLNEGKVFSDMTEDKIKGWDGRKRVSFTSVSNVLVGEDEADIWKLWGKPMPSAYVLPSGGVPYLEDYLGKALTDLGLDTTYCRPDPIEAAMFIDLRKIWDDAQKSSAGKAEFRTLFGELTDDINEVCERPDGNTDHATDTAVKEVQSPEQKPPEQKPEQDSKQSDMDEVKEQLVKIRELLERKDSQGAGASQALVERQETPRDLASIRESLESISDYLGAGEKREILKGHLKRKADEEAQPRAKRAKRSVGCLLA